MVAPYHLKTFGENLREISEDPSSLASRLLLNTHSCPSSFKPSANKPAQALHPKRRIMATSEEGNECDLASARTNARRHPVRSDHQGSDEGGQYRSTPAFSNAEGDGANVGRCSPEFDVLPTARSA